MNISIPSQFLMKGDKIHKSLSMFTPERCEQAKDWADRNNLPLINPLDKWDDIRYTYKKYKSIPIYWQQRVDDACIRCFGIDVKELYNRIKSYIENDGEVSDDATIEKFIDSNEVEQYRLTYGNADTIGMLIEMCSKKSRLGPIDEIKIMKAAKEMEPENPYIDLGYDTPYFTPDEIREILDDEDEKMYIEKFDQKAWLESYENVFLGMKDDRYFKLGLERVQLLKAMNLDDEEEKKKAKLLGWNPDIPYNEETQAKATERIYSILREQTKTIDSVDLSSIIKRSDDTPIDESTLIQVNGLRPVFVVFKRDKTSPVHSIITKATNSFWAHSAISFDISLKKMYSFQSGGFYSESIYDYPPGSIINVMCCFVKDDIFGKMRHAIAGYRRNKNKTSYNFKNLINCLIKKPAENTKSMVCSGFTDFILKIGDISPTKMSFSMVHPGRLKRALTSSKKRRWYNLFKGDYKDYNANKIKVYLMSMTDSSAIEESSVEDMINDTNKEMDEIFKTMVEPYINMIVINDDADIDIELGNDYSLDELF